MKNRPTLKVGEWIYIGSIRCIVSKLYEANSAFGMGEAVYNPQKPTNRDFDWDGEKYYFPDRPDYGGYADRNPQLSEFVWKLKNGK